MALISSLVPILRQRMKSQIFNVTIYYQIIAERSKGIFAQIVDIFCFFDIDIIHFLIDLAIDVWNNTFTLFYWFIILTVLLLFELEITNVNLKRKLIHFALFFIVMRLEKQLIPIFEISILVNHIFSSNLSNTWLFKEFASSRDFGPINISNVLILCSTLYSYVFISNFEDFMFVMISMMILDSFASITGNLLNKKARSVEGSVAGVISAIIVHFLMFRTVKYTILYIIVGMVEYFGTINDNLLIPVFCVSFFRLMKNATPNVSNSY